MFMNNNFPRIKHTRRLAGHNHEAYYTALKKSEIPISSSNAGKKLARGSANVDGCAGIDENLSCGASPRILQPATMGVVALLI
mmetsp:Transcript_27475/g.32507  ORF Transcript_27475/g.32507 Transcript_27475/m.32507 type:complete len:83 (-) Transcript_27475:1242-1490(-)